jgi:omega-6 fatty acid desaturase / acyl-lipid omega-6 desaturase (Delta-12 desaturase)
MAEKRSRVEVGRAPSETPPFTLGDIRRAIPAKCFERNTLKSFRYLAIDVIICSALWYAATWIDSVPSPISWILWPLYWFFQV